MTDTKSRSARLISVAAAVMVVVVGSVIWRTLPKPGPAPAPGLDVTAERAAELIELSHVAIGHLENQQLDAADPLLLEISANLPDDPFGRRNLAICRLIGYEQGKSTAAELEKAIEQLRRAEPESAATYWIEARAALKASADLADDIDASNDQLSKAIQFLQRAADLDPEEVAFPYQLFEAAKHASDPAFPQQARDALHRAFEIAPDNLFVLSEWLMLQAKGQQPAIAGTLESSKDVIRPMQDRIRRQSRVDILKRVDDAIAAVEEGNWPVVSRNVLVVFINLIRPQDFAQSDKRRLESHPLEFAVQDLNSDFLKEFSPDPPKAPSAIDVKMVAFPDSWQLPTVEGIRQTVVEDFNLDGHPDLILLRDQLLEVYVRDAESNSWLLTTSIATPAGMRGMLVADLDHDRDHSVSQRQTLASESARSTEAESGDEAPRACFDADVDIVVFGEPGIMVLRNARDQDSENRSLQVVEQSESIAGVRGIITGVLVDFDADSNLDVVVSTDQGIVPLLALGNMTFDDVSAFSTLPSATSSFSSLVSIDWDRDGDLDVVAVAPGSKMVGYLENLRHGNFRWRPFKDGFASLASADGLVLFDCDANVSWDLAGAGVDGIALARSRMPDPGVIQHLQSQSISDLPQRQIRSWDFDNDGFVDLLAWDAERLHGYRGSPEGSFAKIDALFGSSHAGVTDCDVRDIDADGDLDLAVVSEAKLTLYSNEGGNSNHWLDVRALGQVDNKGKANHNGIGSLLEIKAGTDYQAQMVSRPVTHFGLGSRERADVLRFLWTNGIPQAVVQPESNQSICELMILTGSCPYLYTWTGEEFEFFTDLLWAAPLGLQVAEDVLAPSREWEYLLVPGSRMVPRDGHYELQITEELWEAGYFDQVELIEVLHPADVEVFSNEKVGPAKIAEYKIHTAVRRRTPIAARDPAGNDVLEHVRNRDGDHFKGFTRNIIPGLVDEHFLELDLGKLENPKRIQLFLTGWIYPTTTSLNVALSRHPELTGPKPPSVWVPDANGDWQQTIEYMGFPGGKTKTICVDLSDAFVTNDFRLRISTSNEIYWDEAFFTVDDRPSEVRTNPLRLVSADLHYRGFSEAQPARENCPELYDYRKLSKAAKWAPMRGRFTRYGDVRELLTDTDDLMVVMGSGDEMTLKFKVSDAELPAGWSRDFILHNVGWDKDADPNTVYGQTAEPLPFSGMKSYPYTAPNDYPKSPQHLQFQRRYQTRTQDRTSFWRQIRTFADPSPARSGS